MDIRHIQQLLAEKGLYGGVIDGDAGPQTMRAVEAVMNKAGPVTWRGWPKARLLIAAGQVVLAELGYEPGAVDGLAGHNTAEALTAWLSRDRPQSLIMPRVPGPDYSPSGAQAQYPRQADMVAFYGPPGGPDCTAGTVRLPMPFVLAWDANVTISMFRCHKRLVGPMTAILADAHAHYGGEKMTALGLTIYGGCYNLRKMRGGTSWSMHSWGAAVDLDPQNNQLRWGRDRARFAASEYDRFWEIVAGYGAVSLGRAANRDWMHFQFARL